MDRRTFLRRSAAATGIALAGPFQALSARAATGAPLRRIAGYGPLVPKGDLALPADFNYQVISRQGSLMSDGQLTPGIFDGMGAFRGARGRTILIRNHENRELAGEIKVATGASDYDAATRGGNTKLEVRRTRTGSDPITGQPRYEYNVVRDFAILGGTSSNCAGGVVGRSWISCEEVVKGPTALPTSSAFAPKRHGYIFEIPADADGPIDPVPVKATGRFVHEAVCWTGGVLYLTEDRRRQTDTHGNLGQIGGCFYRYIPDNFTPYNGEEDVELDQSLAPRRLSQTTGKLQALKLRDEWHANMEDNRPVGVAFAVEWVDVPNPDHDDDTDNRFDRTPGFIPTRVQAQDQGAAWFEKMEGIWADEARSVDYDRDNERARKVFFACSDGGPLNLGAVWEYDPAREMLTMLYASVDPAKLQNPDNAVVVPHTGDILLQEDGPDNEHFVRGVTQNGEIYDFVQTLTNTSEFCGGCFDPDGHTFYVNQQGERGLLPNGPATQFAVTYAIYGPFAKLLNRDRS